MSGLFGQTAPVQPGNTPAGLGLFGQPSQSKPAGQTSLFGQQSASTPTGQQPSLFGGTPAAGAGQSQSTLNFGQTPTNAQGQPGQPSAFGFGGNQTVNKPQINVGFGAPTQAQANPGQTSLFGQPQSANTAQQQPTSLFGAPQTSQPGQAGGGLFAAQGMQPQNKATGAPLFGPQSAPQFGVGGGFLQGATQQQQPYAQMQQPMMLSSEQKHQDDVLCLMNIYRQAMEPTSEQNRFRGILYNKMDSKKMDKKTLTFVQENIPATIGNTPVDLDKWIQAAQSNPEKRDLVPTQISSIVELKERTMNVLKAVKDARERIKRANENLQVVEKTCEDDVAKSIRNAADKNMLIRNKLCSVFGKFERVLQEQGRTEVDQSHRDELISRWQALESQVKDPQSGLQRHLDMVKQQNHQNLIMLEQFKGSDTFDGKVNGQEVEKQHVEDADLRDILRVLQTQKQGIQILQGSLRTSASQLMVMEKEINISKIGDAQ